MDKNNPEYLKALRHTAEHILMQAMEELWPGKIIKAMGPPTDDGFYFDFEAKGVKISEDDFPRIEEKMYQIVQRNLPLVRKEISVEEARKLFANNPYKQEWLDEIGARGEKAVVYYTGLKSTPGAARRDSPGVKGENYAFVDLCAGPHVKSTGEVKAFKLLKVAGAYWRGDERNKMLTRIYGTAFPSQKELDDYLKRLEEAKKRDHRKLGQELELFVIPSEVGPGLLIWLPNGATVRREIEKLIYQEQEKRGYLHVYSPHIGRKQLWVTSGHWDLYRDKMYAPMTIDEEEYLVKPMNCPFHMMVYRARPRSYRELPLRVAEIASVYRYERPGELSGMLRVRYITQDDAHIFCRPDQVMDEFLRVFDLITFLLATFGVEDYRFRISLRDPKNKDKYLGDDAIWQEAEAKIIEAVEKKKVPYFKAEGEAAFYGPKLDVIVKDALGREWQAGTIQIDFMLPERFQLEYIDADGQKRRPVLIHRAPLGSLERWVGFLIEHYGGAFPVWLAPIQAVVLPITEKHNNYTQKLVDQLKEEGVRVKLDNSNQTLSYRIRHWEMQKVPYLLVVGDREAKRGTVNVRKRGEEKQVELELAEFKNYLKDKISHRSLGV